MIRTIEIDGMELKVEFHIEPYDPGSRECPPSGGGIDELVILEGPPELNNNEAFLERLTRTIQEELEQEQYH